jgi:hypothetical protein
LIANSEIKNKIATCNKLWYSSFQHFANGIEKGKVNFEVLGKTTVAGGPAQLAAANEPSYKVIFFNLV